MRLLGGEASCFVWIAGTSGVRNFRDINYICALISLR